MLESKDSEQRKQEFIDAAEKLFKENGIVDTTINSIVKEVNVAKGLFYYYFKSKEDVIEAISEKYNTVFKEMMQEAMDQPGYDERLDQYIENCVKSFRTLSEQVDDSEVDLTVLRARSTEEALRSSSHGLMLLIMEGNADDILSVERPEYLAVMLVNGIAALVHEGKAADEEICEMVSGLIRRP